MRRLLLMVLGIVVGFVLATATISGLNYFQMTQRPALPGNAHLAYLTDAVERGGGKLDFAKLNDGYWSWLCLFGAGTRPILFLRTEAARRGEALEITPDIGRLFFNGEKEPGALGDNDGAMAVVDDLGHVSLVRFSGIGPVTQLKGPVCTDHKNPQVDLAGK